MVDKKEVARRFVVAHIYLMSQIGVRVTLAELAERVTKAHGSRRFTPSQISEYQKAVVAQPPDVVWAYAKATLTDPGWLYFGEDTAAPAPSGFSGVPDAPLTPAPRKRSTKKRGHT
jgi:hypothetical protein